MEPVFQIAKMLLQVISKTKGIDNMVIEDFQMLNGVIKFGEKLHNDAGMIEGVAKSNDPGGDILKTLLPEGEKALSTLIPGAPLGVKDTTTEGVPGTDATLTETLDTTAPDYVEADRMSGTKTQAS